MIYPHILRRASKRLLLFSLLLVGLLLTGCGIEFEPPTDGSETGRVINVIDGDTIVVDIGGRAETIRYVGINTPERDEPCYWDATRANEALVDGRTVRLVRDVTNRDRYDRLLRYVYVGDTLVGRELIAQGYAEVVLYEPDDRFYEEYRSLEIEAARAGRGCHPTGIFNDGNDRR